MSSRVLSSREFNQFEAVDFLRAGNLSYAHPDWLNQQERLTDPFTQALEENGSLLAILCTAKEHVQVAWVRFFTCLRDGRQQLYFDRLLSAALASHQNSGTRALFSIALNDWVSNLLSQSGFTLSNQIVTLACQIDHTTTALQNTPIRQMEPDDFSAVLALDRLAFPPEWRLDQASLTRAYARAAIATVSLDQQKIIGYSLTNATFGAGHLNRLAVHPSYWGTGRGRQMLFDLNTRCSELGITHLTVNTQADNLRSLSLYKHAGFTLSGETMNIYCHSVVPTINENLDGNS